MAFEILTYSQNHFYTFVLAITHTHIHIYQAITFLSIFFHLFSSFHRVSRQENKQSHPRKSVCTFSFDDFLKEKPVACVRKFSARHQDLSGILGEGEAFRGYYIPLRRILNSEICLDLFYPSSPPRACSGPRLPSPASPSSGVALVGGAVSRELLIAPTLLGEVSADRA